MQTALSELQAPPEPHPPGIAIEDVSRDLSRIIERAEVNAWLDLYAAAPADFAARQGLSIARKATSPGPPARRSRSSISTA